MTSTAYKEASLCRTEHNSCGACCWGPQVSREELQIRLEQHRQSFVRWTKSGSRLSAWRLFVHETLSHRGRNLLWAIALRVPLLAKRLKQQLARKLTCAFLGFDDETKSRPGCMLHPVRFDGNDVRQPNAFRFLSGIVCGDPKFVCNVCQQVDGDPTQRQQLVQITLGMDWYDYSETVRLISAGLVRPDGTVIQSVPNEPAAENHAA